jgi:hypothetical protein
MKTILYALTTCHGTVFLYENESSLKKTLFVVEIRFLMDLGTTKYKILASPPPLLPTPLNPPPPGPKESSRVGIPEKKPGG